MEGKSTDYRLGYQQAQLDILRHCLKGNNLYLSSDSMRLARAVLGFTDVPVLDDPAPVMPPANPEDFEGII